MIQQCLRVAVAAAVLMCCDMAVAQNCGGCGGHGLGGGMNFSLRPQNCGRFITQAQAESAWGSYCYDTCDFGGGCGRGCKLGGKLRGKFGGGAMNGCGCGGCNMGCFGYPTGGCGCGGGMLGGGKLAGLRGGCGGKLKGLFAGAGCGMSACNSGCGTSMCGSRGGCKLGGKLKGLFSGGCGLFSKSRSACGQPGAYFGEAVGYEYGTAGMQSCVAGCSSCCNGGYVGTSAPAQVMPAAPAVGNSVINGAHSDTNTYEPQTTIEGGELKPEDKE